MIEGRIERNKRAFVGRDGAQHVLLVHAAPKCLMELHLVVPVAGDLGNSIADACGAHLDGIGDWERCLLLERIDSAVPELRLVVKRIQNGRGVALTEAAVDADRRGPAVGESACWIVARGAGDRAVT